MVTKTPGLCVTGWSPAAKSALAPSIAAARARSAQLSPTPAGLGLTHLQNIPRGKPSRTKGAAGGRNSTEEAPSGLVGGLEIVPMAPGARILDAILSNYPLNLLDSKGLASALENSEGESVKSLLSEPLLWRRHWAGSGDMLGARLSMLPWGPGSHFHGNPARLLNKAAPHL